MPLHTITAEEALQRLDAFDTIIDARSENEYAEDHLPGAVNWPSLNDEERKQRRKLKKSRREKQRRHDGK